MKDKIVKTIFILAVFMLGMAASAYNIDPLWENTLGPGNQGNKACAASGDSWDCTVASSFLGGNGNHYIVSSGRNIHLNSYSNGPWRVSFTDYGTAHYKNWPNAISYENVIAWHSQIYPTSGGFADVYLLQYSDAVSSDLAAAAIREELASERGVENPTVTLYNDGSATGQGTNTLGTQEYAKFTPLPNKGPNYALFLMTDDYSVFDVGNSIKVS